MRQDAKTSRVSGKASNKKLMVKKETVAQVRKIVEGLKAELKVEWNISKAWRLQVDKLREKREFDRKAVSAFEESNRAFAVENRELRERVEQLAEAKRELERNMRSATNAFGAVNTKYNEIKRELDRCERREHALREEHSSLRDAVLAFEDQSEWDCDDGIACQAWWNNVLYKLQATEGCAITKCPKCGGDADQGFDRCVPPNPYYCTKCDPSYRDDAGGAEISSEAKSAEKSEVDGSSPSSQPAPSSFVGHLLVRDGVPYRRWRASDTHDTSCWGHLTCPLGDSPEDVPYKQAIENYGHKLADKRSPAIEDSLYAVYRVGNEGEPQECGCEVCGGTGRMTSDDGILTINCAACHDAKQAEGLRCEHGEHRGRYELRTKDGDA